MPGAADFNPSHMSDVLIEQRKIMIGRMPSQMAFKPGKNTLKAVVSTQTGKPNKVMDDAGSCQGVKVAWLYRPDSGNHVEPAFACVFEGVEGESKNQTIAPNIRITKRFRTKDDQCKDMFTFIQKLAADYAHYKSEIEEIASKQINTTLYANITPASSFPGKEPRLWDLSGVPYLYPNEEIQKPARTLAQLDSIIKYNAIPNPVVIGDSAWETNAVLATFLNNQGGAEYNEAGLFDTSGKRWFFDAPNLDALNDDYGKALVFDPNNVLFWSHNQWENTEPKKFVGDQYVFRDPSMYINMPNGQPLYYDVRMNYTCVEGQNGNVALAVDTEIKLMGGFIIGEATKRAGDKGIHYFAELETT